MGTYNSAIRRGRVRAMRPTFYEFFAGGGMARAGLSPDWDCLFANDIDPKKADAYKTNWGDAEFRLGQAAEIGFRRTPRRNKWNAGTRLPPPRFHLQGAVFSPLQGTAAALMWSGYCGWTGDARIVHGGRSC